MRATAQRLQVVGGESMPPRHSIDQRGLELRSLAPDLRRWRGNAVGRPVWGGGQHTDIILRASFTLRQQLLCRDACTR